MVLDGPPHPAILKLSDHPGVLAGESVSAALWMPPGAGAAPFGRPALLTDRRAERRCARHLGGAPPAPGSLPISRGFSAAGPPWRGGSAAGRTSRGARPALGARLAWGGGPGRARGGGRGPVTSGGASGASAAPRSPAEAMALGAAPF